MSSSIKVLSRALGILHTLANKNEPFSLAEITEQTGLPKSTVHHLLQGLEFEQAVKKVRPGYYTIGKSLIALGAKVVRGGLVFRVAPFMRKLRDKTGYSVYLSSVNKYELVYLHRAPGEVIPSDNKGYQGDVLWTTGGRAILSTYKEEQLDDVLKNVDFIPRTQHSIKTKQELKLELQVTQKRGYSMFENEYIIGLESVGAPIFDANGECIASLSMVGVTKTLSKSMQIDLLFETIKEISEIMGNTT